VLAKKPKDLPTITKLGELYVGAGNPYAALLVLGKASEISETAQILNLMGVATARLGELQVALGLFDRASKKEPTFGPPHANKAALLGQFGYSVESKAELKKIRAGDTFADGTRGWSGAHQLVGGPR